MNRAFLLPLAAATVLSGCIVAADPHDPYNPPVCTALGAANFYWRFQDGRGGLHGNFTSTNPGCFDAGVDGIDVIVDGVRRQVNCVERDQSGNLSPAIQMANLTEGRHAWTIEAYRGNEQVYATGGTVFVPCGSSADVDATLQALTPQSMVIYYSFAGNGSSCPPGVASMGYWLYAGTSLVSSSSSFPCDQASLGFTTPQQLPFGNYDAVLEAYDRFGNALYVNCGAALGHDGAAQFVDLAPSAQLCP